MSALNRKLLRDIGHLKTQLIAVTLVTICGIALFVALRSMHGYLTSAQRDYYRDYRFAHVFASVVRAPSAIARPIARMPGVAETQARIATEVRLDVPGLDEPATGRLISIPVRRRRMINDLFIARGDYPGAARNEVLVSNAFAKANALSPGDVITAIINGRREELHISGMATSPEFIYEIRSGDIFPDNRRFGVIWMTEPGLAAALDMEGAFNELALTLSPGASEADVIARLDTLLRPYGGSGAYGREQQVSHLFVSSEITETQVTSILLPTIFLGVTVFLLHMVLSRLVATQREQVGVLKAFGYASSTIALHFAGLAVITMISGAILGSMLGLYLAGGLANVYAQFFQFPSTTFVPDFRIAMAALVIASVSGIAGAASAALRAARLPAAVAMRPEAPPHYSRGILDRVGILRLPLTGRIIIRNIGRAPLKAGLFILGVALAAALFLTTRYMFDAIDYIARVQFDEVHRWDIMVAFDRPLGDPVKHELAQLRGVQQVEPFRAIAARLTAGSRQERIELWGLVSDPALRRVVDARRISWPPPDDGILITTRLANKLRVQAGDIIRLEVLTGERMQTNIRVAGAVDELLGMSAYMSEGALRRTLREAPLYSGAFLTVRPGEVEGVYRELNTRPRVSGVSSLHTARASFDETIAESFRISLSMAVLFAIIIACGVVYNGARISLSERGRELASLRILGFSRAEVARMLLGEQGVLTLFALPLGFLFGVMLCWLVSVRFESDLFRIPLVLEPRSFLLTALIILAAAFGSALAVGARIYRLDLVSVLKTRE